MTRLPRITAKQLIKALKKAGFEPVRRKGSHVILKDSRGHSTVVPAHSGEILGPGITKKILRDCELAVEDLIELLK
jgi:predicted RNA binding protein YcfA (HicA-like mRNA interferase family)